MNKVMLFLGIVLVVLLNVLHAQSVLGFYDQFIWIVFGIVLIYFVVRSLILPKS